MKRRSIYGEPIIETIWPQLFVQVVFYPHLQLFSINYSFIRTCSKAFCQIEQIFFVSRVNVKMIMPDILAAGWLIMLARSNTITIICIFHCESCKLRCTMNFSCILRREFINIFKVLIRHNENVSFIVWPPFTSYKSCYMIILEYHISLFCPFIGYVQTRSDLAKWAYISFWHMRPCFYHLFSSPI